MIFYSVWCIMQPSWSGRALYSDNVHVAFLWTLFVNCFNCCKSICCSLEESKLPERSSRWHRRQIKAIHFLLKEYKLVLQTFLNNFCFSFLTAKENLPPFQWNILLCDALPSAQPPSALVGVQQFSLQKGWREGSGGRQFPRVIGFLSFEANRPCLWWQSWVKYPVY